MEELNFIPYQFLWHVNSVTLFLLLLFSGIIAKQSKDKTFKYYAIYCLFLLFYFLLKTPYDHSFRNLVYDSRYAGINWYLQVIYNCAYFFFFLNFLNIKDYFLRFYNQIKRTILIIFSISSIFFLYSILVNSTQVFDFYFLYLFTPLMTLLGLYTIYKSLHLDGNMKYFFCIGSGVYILLAVIALVNSYNFTRNDFFLPLFYFYAGVFIEQIVFAFGLAYKVKIIQQKMHFQYKENVRIKGSQQHILRRELRKKEKEVLRLSKAVERDRIEKLKSKFEDEAYQLHLSSLQSQMNPHFIFNALNSIKVFLIENNKEQAVYYLNKFSKLIRKILESSRITEVELSEELETISLYLNIESMRFDSQIDFKVDIALGIDTKLIKVPPLILQPFVENALWHGLMLSHIDKRINISVYRSEQTVCLSLKDNGIGRKASRKNQQQKTIKKESLGLRLTKERIDFYNRKKRKDYSYLINDLYDMQNKPTGTEVIFTFG